MKPPRRSAFSALALALAVASASSARGADPGSPPAPPTPGQIQAARELFAAASKDEAAARWEDALEKLRRVAGVKLTAGVRYHIAFCEEKLGRIATALAHYTEARDAAVREHSAEVLDLLRDPFLADLRARVPTLSIDVPADAAGAVVTIDAHPHPSALWSVAVPIDPGPHHIEATAPGREPFATDVTLHEREVTDLDLVLRPLAPPPAPVAVPVPSSPPPPSLAAPPPPPSPDLRPAPAPPASSPPSPHVRLAPVLSSAGALVFAGGGVAAFLAAGSAQSTGQSECLTRTTSCDDLKSPVRTWDAVALGAWIGAGALATTAVVLWATTESRARTGSGPAARFAIGPGRVALEGNF